MMAFLFSTFQSTAPLPLRSAGALQSRLVVRRSLVGALIFAAIVFPIASLAQDSRELQQERSASNKLKGEHPLVELMRTRKSTLRTELMGVHPRVYVTDKELADLRIRAHTTHRELWQQALSHVRALNGDPPPPPAE